MVRSDRLILFGSKDVLIPENLSPLSALYHSVKSGNTCRGYRIDWGEYVADSCLNRGMELLPDK
jgi:hypothetical protein